MTPTNTTDQQRPAPRDPRRPADSPALHRALGGLSVADAMHMGLISCPPDAPLRTVARMMATYRVHALLVQAHGEDAGDDRRWAVVTDADLLRAAERVDLDEDAARAVAATPSLMVFPTDALARAAELLVAHDVSHVVVVEPHIRRPIGVLSTLDIARALAGFPERHPVRAP